MNQQPDWQPQQAQQTSACPKCGGVMIEAQVPWYGDASAHLVSANNNSLFSGLRWSGLSALVCRNCGFVEFYAQKPREIDSGATALKHNAAPWTNLSEDVAK